MGSFLYAPLARASAQDWVDPTANPNNVEADIRAAVDVARRLGARRIAIIAGRAENMPILRQQENMAKRLRWVAAIAEDQGLTLCLEAVAANRLPGMLLHHFTDAASVVQMAEHAAVRLVFDTGHVAAMNGDLLGLLNQYSRLIEVIQIADSPGRVEAGGASIDFDAFFAALHRLGHTGLCELEHRWSSPDVAVQQMYLERLSRWHEEN